MRHGIGATQARFNQKLNLGPVKYIDDAYLFKICCAG